MDSINKKLARPLTDSEIDQTSGADPLGQPISWHTHRPIETSPNQPPSDSAGIGGGGNQDYEDDFGIDFRF